MNTVFPIHSRYFSTINSINHGNEKNLDDELVRFLVLEGYVLSQGQFGWALTNKGREFIRQYRNDRCYLEIVRADWPMDLLAVLRRCEFNSNPQISKLKLKDLVNTGYLKISNSGEYLLTEKGKKVLDKYPEL